MKSRAAETLIPAITEQVDRRKSLLQAAFDVIALSGFEGLRTRAVAQRAGVNIATLHYYFPTKQALIEGLAQFLSGIFASLHAPSPASTGRPALDHLRQEFIDARFYHEHYPELEVVLQELSLRANRDPAVRSALASLVSSWRAWVESLRHGGRGGRDLPPGPRSSSDDPDADGGLRRETVRWGSKSSKTFSAASRSGCSRPKSRQNSKE